MKTFAKAQPIASPRKRPICETRRGSSARINKSSPNSSKAAKQARAALAARFGRTKAGARRSRTTRKTARTTAGTDAPDGAGCRGKRAASGQGAFTTRSRKATEQRIPDALKVSQQLVDLGVSEDAAKASTACGARARQLREGVERAAKSVLGDETAALRSVRRASLKTSATSSIARSPKPLEHSPTIGAEASHRQALGQGRDAERPTTAGAGSR